MREIKFRVWHKNTKSMNYDPYVVEGAGPINWEFSSENICNKEYIWIQYTGLKDKNGKEIYEGDILKWTHPDFKELKKEYKILEMSDIRKSLMIEPDCQNGWIEIIGNIYENPDLLTQKP